MFFVRILAVALALLNVHRIVAQCEFCAGNTLSRPTLPLPFLEEDLSEDLHSISGLRRLVRASYVRRRLQSDGEEPTTTFLTCQALQDAASDVPVAACPTQEDLQQLLYACGCPAATDPPPDACGGICPEGSPANPDAAPFGPILDMLGIVGSPLESFRYATCEFAHLILEHESRYFCTSIQNLNDITEACGCSAAVESPPPRCGLCGHGMDLPEYGPDSEVPLLLQTYCEIVDKRLPFRVLTEETCVTELDRRFFVNFQDACGCDVTESSPSDPIADDEENEDLSPCTVCPGGLDPLYPDNVLLNVNNLLGDRLAGSITCGEANAFLGVMMRFSSFTCPDFRSWGTLFCGCPPTEVGLRSLCPDFVPMSTPDEMVPQVVVDAFVDDIITFNNTQFDLDVVDEVSCGAFGNLIVAGSARDAFVDTTLPAVCGCESVLEAGGPTCSVCSDGSPLPGPSIPLNSYGLTCELLEMQVGLADDAVCGATQAMGLYCNCSKPIAATLACRICGEGNMLPQPTRTVPSIGLSCYELEATANLDLATMSNSTGICSMYQGYYAQVCCTEATDGNSSATAAPNTPSVMEPAAPDMPTTVSNSQTNAPSPASHSEGFEADDLSPTPNDAADGPTDSSAGSSAGLATTVAPIPLLIPFLILVTQWLF